MRLSILYPGCRYDPTKSLVWRDALSGMAFSEVGEVGWSGIVFLGGALLAWMWLAIQKLVACWMFSCVG